MKKKNRLLRLSLIVAILAFLSSGALSAATITFVGPGADWNTAANWSPAQVPTTADDAIIPTGFNVTTSGAVDAKTISIYGNSTLTIDQTTNIATAGTGGITLNGTSSLVIDAAVTVNIGNATYRGDIVQNDNSNITFSTAAATVTLSGTWTKSSNATITNTIPPNFTVVGTTAVTLPSTLNTLNAFTVNKPGSTCTLSGALTVTGALAVNAGTLIVGNYNLSVGTTTNIATGATLNAASTGTNTRTFTSAITLNGTLISSGGGVTNWFNAAALTIPATGTLTINNSTSTFGGTLGASGAGATINALGAQVTFQGIVTFTNLTLNTNSNTNLTFNAAQTAAGDQIPALTVNNLTFANNNATLAGNVTVYGNLSKGTGTLNVGSNTLTVYGTLTNPNTGVINISNATLILYGGLALTTNDEAEFVTGANTNLQILGSGPLPSATDYAIGAATTIGTLTLNRPNATFFIGGNFAVTINNLTITAGTLNLANASHQLSNVTIGANGVLDLDGVTATASNVTVSNLAGSGKISFLGGSGTNYPVLILSGTTYTFTGEIYTNANTDLRITNTTTSDINLPSSITTLRTLTINRGNVARKVILNSNLTIGAAIGATEFASGRLELNGKTLTLNGTYTSAAAANFILDATGGSTVIFNGAPTFVANALVTNQTTNFQFGVAATIDASITTLNNLTITSGTTAQAAALTLYGNLTVANGATHNKATFNLTVYGNVSNSGTLTWSGAGTITLHGQLIGSGTYTTGASTILSIQGSSSQFVLPASVTTLGRITLNRPTGMKIMNNLAVGDGAALNNDVDIQLGDFDLNGFNVTLADDDAQISETAGNTFINTGASTATTGYVTTQTTTTGNIQTSGIGVSAITAAGNVAVLRFPRTVVIPGIGLATHRIYQVTGNNVTAVTLAFDNTELYSAAADLKLYHTTAFTFNTFTEVSGTVTENTPVTGKGQLAVTGVSIASGSYYAMAAVPGDGGVLRTFVGASGNWGDPNSWSPAGVPTKVDQVTIGAATVTLNGNGVIYECKTLNLNHSNATLQPANNGTNGDVVTLRVMGNITLAAGAEILGVNGTGRLNLIIGDGTTAGVSSTIAVNNNYISGAGIWVHNLTVNAADVTGSANRIRISGDVALLANSAVQGLNAEFWGGYDPLQTISVPASAFLSFGTIRTDNNANVGTTSNFTLTNQLDIRSGSTFNATGGTAFFTNPVAGSGDPWAVQSGGTLKLFNVQFNSSGGTQTFVPTGTAYIQGNFYQYGTDDFDPTSGFVIFDNTSQREIVNTQASGDLRFYGLRLTSGSKVVTSNSFEIRKEIDVQGNGSFIANNGTITFIGNGDIKNASDQTLVFNNLTINATVNTSDSWKIQGNLTISGSGQLLADGGTITFQNISEKSINNGNTLRFFKLKVANGSKLTTLTGHNFTIQNNSTNPTGAGIEVEGTGEFYVGSAASVITFNVGTGVAAGNPKIITKSPAGRLEFGTIVIAANPNNEVSTSSDFTITGTGANTFNNAGAGGKFTATAGTITFTGAAPEISSISPASTQFYSLKTTGSTVLSTPAAQAQELFVAGDLVIDGTSSMDFDNNTNSKIIFNGSSLQKITGSTVALTPISFADLQLNKTGNSELLLELNTQIASNTAHEMTLTNGILNLGSKTFTVGAGVISRINGVINGGTGTYVVATNHATPTLDDTYFTVSGTPTLYNLTINAAHTTAGDLTVNGTLNLALADLTIASGNSAANPVKLILNGNLTRTSGEIDGSSTLSRLVLQGSGTVANGLSNTYFQGGTATTVQLEVARQETLGGNLTIANTSFLRINTGINDFDLGNNTLTFNTSFNLVMISGGIKAGTGSTVVLPNIANLVIPATMFRNNECHNLTIANTITLAGDLRINGTLTGAFTITTNNNILTFGPSASLPAFNSTAYVNGNLRRFVTNNPIVYNVGISNRYIPVTLQFANSSSQQAIVVRPKYQNPTLGKGGDPLRALLAMWSIKPEGTALTDSIKVNFEWPNTIHNNLTPAANVTFAAKWGGNSWIDYRKNASYSSQVLTMTSFPVKGSAALNGDWGIFVATANTDAAKDAAIKTTGNKLVITSIEPTPVVLGQSFKVTVQLQNEFGQAIPVTSAFNFTLKLTQGAGTFTNITSLIPPGQSYVTLQGLSITGSAGSNHQFTVEAVSPSEALAGVSQLFDVIPAAPTSQATAITFSNTTATTTTISWTNGNGNSRIVVIKPDTLLKLSEYPVNGETYYGNTIMGLGSSIGGATVLHVGDGPINIVGLAPNTKYYVYVFEYNGTDYNENYLTVAAAGNPKSFTTTGSYDDDITFGINNTRALSKAIGTNSPIRGTIKNSTDEDWFNFSVSSTTPNVRAKLTNLPGNYTLELYDMTGRRIRRSTLNGKSSEAVLANDLPAGTYTVRIFSADGSYWTKSGEEYILQVNTYGSEIYSVTP